MAFWTRFFFFCPPGAAVFPRKLAGCLVTTRPSPGNRVYTHTPRDGPGSRQHGGARHLLGLFTKRVSHFSVAADSAPARYWDFEVAPGVEGELFEPTVSLGRPRGLVASRSILWAAGCKKPTPGLLWEGDSGVARLHEEKEVFSYNGGTEIWVPPALVSRGRALGRVLSGEDNSQGQRRRCCEEAGGGPWSLSVLRMQNLGKGPGDIHKV